VNFQEPQTVDSDSKRQQLSPSELHPELLDSDTLREEGRSIQPPSLAAGRSEAKEAAEPSMLAGARSSRPPLPPRPPVTKAQSDIATEPSTEPPAPDDESADEPPIVSQDPVECVVSEESERNRLRSVLHGVPPWSVSLVLHLAGMILLAFWTLVANEDRDTQILVASTVEEVALEIQDTVEFEIEKLEEVELENVSLDMQMPDPGLFELASIETIETVGNLDVSTVSEVTVHEIGALFGEHGQGMAMIGEGLGAASFFGAKAPGSRFVFVVDNSNSMGGGRFETALSELMKTVNGMTPHQSFYVVFFSDTAYRLFHPQPVMKMVPATDDNKQKLRSWLGTVEMCLKTKGVEAMQTAFALQPDVIYILGDGRFTDRAGMMLVAPHRRRVPIHTLGMEVDAIGKREFQAIAKANRGTYRNVSANRRAKSMAAKTPIKKNRTRGYVWGITLPEPVMRRRS
jgi:hypothetical protein